MDLVTVKKMADLDEKTKRINLKGFSKLTLDFLDVNDDGKVNIKDVFALARKIGIKVLDADGDKKINLKDIILLPTVLDSDKDGKIETDEVIKYLLKKAK